MAYREARNIRYLTMLKVGKYVPEGEDTPNCEVRQDFSIPFLGDCSRYVCGLTYLSCPLDSVPITSRLIAPIQLRRQDNDQVVRQLADLTPCYSIWEFFNLIGAWCRSQVHDDTYGQLKIWMMGDGRPCFQYNKFDEYYIEFSPEFAAMCHFDALVYKLGGGGGSSSRLFGR